MGMRAGTLALRTIRNAVLATAVFLLGAGTNPAVAADITAPPEAEAASYTYLNLEGGYIDLDGAKVQGFLQGSVLTNDDTLNYLRERSLNISQGYYARAELGHAWGTGLVNGVGAYVQG